MANNIKNVLSKIAVVSGMLISIESAAFGAGFSPALAANLTNNDSQTVQSTSNQPNYDFQGIKSNVINAGGTQGFKGYDLPGVPVKLAIMPSDRGVNIGDIKADSININTGNTNQYTVDTPAGAGLTTVTIKTVQQLLSEITSQASTPQTYTVKGADGTVKAAADFLIQGDVLTVTSGNHSHDYKINFVKGAVRGNIELLNSQMTARTQSNVVVNFSAGMRSPNTTVVVHVPKGINATMDNTTVNVIGRGEVKLSGLATQSVGRVGAGYRFQKVGTVSIDNNDDGSQTITFKGLDLRPDNGTDLQLTFNGVSLNQGSYQFDASYTTAEPETLTSPTCSTTLNVVKTISDFSRVLDKSLTYKESADTYTSAKFTWSAVKNNAHSIKLLESTDKGATWTDSNASINADSGEVAVSNLTPNNEYWFKLDVKGGDNHGDSNIAKFYTGKFDAKLMGAKGDGVTDDTDAINNAITYLNSIGGGTLLFEGGTFNVRTVHLKSNVYLYINQDATLSAIKGQDAPETTYFDDWGYRSGTSPTDPGPYNDPENFMTKQDVGHQYWQNSMFYGERIDNFKIIGNGRITGNGNLVSGDDVMDLKKHAADTRADKLISVKLSTNFEFGGLENGKDLAYQETNSSTINQPYYLDKDGSKSTNLSNMLKVDNTGHFALLSSGTDHINTHDFYQSAKKGDQTRDMFDYMESSDIHSKNVYVTGTSDDIEKPGSDSALGFTRPASDFYIRNVIGDTNCNLFQIGSETADDITNAYVDNIYALGSNKAGFSISTNDGGTVENIYLNSGKTGAVYQQSQMRRTRAPFFISISNRGRIIGGQAQMYSWTENGKTRNELLSTNVNIGHVRNIYIKDVNIEQVYQGSAWQDPAKGWAPYTNQSKASPIIAGYQVPQGGPVLPDGRSIGYIENVNFENVNITAEGGNPLSDSQVIPPELGVGKYNVGDFGVQPSYGFWVRHVDGISFKNVTTNFVKNDDRYALTLDDVKNANVDHMTMAKGANNPSVIQVKNSSNVTVTNSSSFNNGDTTTLNPLADLNNVTVTGNQTY